MGARLLPMSGACISSEIQWKLTSEVHVLECFSSWFEESRRDLNDCCISVSGWRSTLAEIHIFATALVRMMDISCVDVCSNQALEIVPRVVHGIIRPCLASGPTPEALTATLASDAADA